MRKSTTDESKFLPLLLIIAVASLALLAGCGAETPEAEDMPPGQPAGQSPLTEEGMTSPDDAPRPVVIDPVRSPSIWYSMEADQTPLDAQASEEGAISPWLQTGQVDTFVARSGNLDPMDISRVSVCFVKEQGGQSTTRVVTVKLDGGTLHWRGPGGASLMDAQTPDTGAAPVVLPASFFKQEGESVSAYHVPRDGQDPCDPEADGHACLCTGEQAQDYWIEVK